MEKEKPTTPTMRRAQNVNRTRTPDRNDGSARARSRGRVRARATMAPTDFAVPGALPARRPTVTNSSRMSVMPSNNLDATSRRIEPETHNELELLYDKYLQTLMEKHILKKKAREREKAIVCQLTTLLREKEQCDQKLHEIKVKESEVSALDELQKSSDAQIKEITDLLQAYQGKPIETLNQIEEVLKSLDTLVCKNIIIPTAPEDLEKFATTLEDCNDCLKWMNSAIGDKGKAVTAGNTGLKNFVQAHETLEKQMETLKDAIESLQIQVLKKASAAVSPTQDLTVYGR